MPSTRLMTRTAGSDTGRRLRRLGVAAAMVLGATTALAAPALAFTPAAHTPLPNLSKHAYVGKPLRVITIVKDDGKPRQASTFDSRVIWFGHALVRSKWYKAASAAYQLGPNGTSKSDRVTNMPTANGNLTVAQLEAKVRSWANAMQLHKNAGVRTIFVIYLPCILGTTFGTFGRCGSSSFHPGLTVTTNDPNFTTGDTMAVVMTPTTGSLTVDGATVAASHEVIEGATDTDNGWRMTSSTPANPFDVSPWVFNEGGRFSNTEVMDMSGGSAIREKFTDPTHGYDYRYERVYTVASAQANGDPFVPKSPIGFASVSTKATSAKAHGWISASSAVKTHHITLTAWSTKAVPDWSLSTQMMAWKGFASSPATTDRCAASLNKTTVNNGTKVTLTVTYSGSPTKSYWCAIKVKSTTSDPTNNDSFRQWLVGVKFNP
jgi:hypothetical protein